MSFIGTILTELIKNFKNNPNLESMLQHSSLLEIDRKGYVTTHMPSIPVYRFPIIYSRHDYTGSQLRKFNGYNYRVGDLIEFYRHPEKLVAHLIAISLKEKVHPNLKFAAIDTCGKVYAYTNHPRYNRENGKWDGHPRKFICRLSSFEYTPYLLPEFRVFNISEWTFSHCAPDILNEIVPEKQIDLKPIEYVKSGISVDIQAHIKSRVESIEADHQKIGELNENISKMREEILRLNNHIALTSCELTTLVEASKIMSNTNG